MDDATLVILLLLGALLLLWLLVLGPKAKEAREERQRLDAEERARREAERAWFQMQQRPRVEMYRGL